MKKAIALALSLVLSLGMLASCGGSGGKEPEYTGPSYDALTVGTDYTDLTAELRVITQRTDLVDTTFAKHVEAFNKLYPNIKINYEGITNYQDDMTARLSSKNWGDICMIPTTILLPASPNLRSSMIVRTPSFASSSEPQISTPFPSARPSAFKTIGNLAVSRYLSASAGSVKFS